MPVPRRNKRCESEKVLDVLGVERGCCRVLTSPKRERVAGRVGVEGALIGGLMGSVGSGVLDEEPAVLPLADGSCRMFLLRVDATAAVLKNGCISLDFITAD